MKATIHGASFSSVTMNSKVTLAVQDIEDEVFWKAIYVLLWAVYPALKALRFCNSNIPAMDKIYYLTRKAEETILKSVQDLDDDKIFGPSGSVAFSGCDDEFEEIFGAEKESLDDSRYVGYIFFFLCH